MKSATPRTEVSPSTQLRKAVLGGSPLKHTLTRLLALVLALPAALHAAESQPDQSVATRLYLPGAIESSLDAIPLGNGLSGGLLWGSGTNVFCIEGRSELAKGDQSRPENGKVVSLENVVFENSLYLHPDTWPAAVQIQDRAPLVGDPGFLNPGGLRMEDYTPRNGQLVKKRGVRISRIPHDKIGLAVGLEVGQDSLGKRIVGRPDIGAIQMQ